jgi:hypothetical protein
MVVATDIAAHLKHKTKRIRQCMPIRQGLEGERKWMTDTESVFGASLISQILPGHCTRARPSRICQGDFSKDDAIIVTKRQRLLVRALDELAELGSEGQQIEIGDGEDGQERGCQSLRSHLRAYKAHGVSTNRSRRRCST